MALAFSPMGPMGKEEMSRRVASMSVGDAFKQLDGKLPLQVVTLVEGVRGNEAQGTGAFLQTAGHGFRKGTMNKKTVESARLKMNEMIEDVQENLDKECVRCSSTIYNEEEILNETALDIALYRAQNTQADSDHIRAQGSISTLDSTVERLE